jgi:hypothetical protein
MDAAIAAPINPGRRLNAVGAWVESALRSLFHEQPGRGDRGAEADGLDVDSAAPAHAGAASRRTSQSVGRPLTHLPHSEQPDD